MFALNRAPGAYGSVPDIAMDGPNAQALSARALGEVPYIGIMGGVIGSWFMTQDIDFGR